MNWDDGFFSFNWKMLISLPLTVVFPLLWTRFFSESFPFLDFINDSDYSFSYGWKILLNMIVNVGFINNWKSGWLFLEIPKKFIEDRIWRNFRGSKGRSLWARIGLWSHWECSWDIFYDETKYFFSFYIFLCLFLFMSLIKRSTQS